MYLELIGGTTVAVPMTISCKNSRQEINLRSTVLSTD